MNFTCGGGSSRVFRSALKECCDSMWTSSMMKILKRLRMGWCATVANRSRILSTCVCDAPSISSTSNARPSAISRQFAHSLHGSWLTPRSQLSALARSRAVVVLPTPRGPAKRNAWATRPTAIAACRVRVTCSCPTTSAKRWGRSRRARTWYVIGGRPPRGARRWRLGYPAAQRDSRYRCFLPDLTGFATLSCAGPNHHRPAPRGGDGQRTRLGHEAQGDADRTSGEGGIRTLGTLWVHTLSRRAPSAARAPLRPANRRKCRREVQAGRGTLRVVECARGPQCGSRSRRHGWHTTLATSARSAAAPPAATRRRQPSLRPASADRRRPRGEPPRRHP